MDELVELPPFHGGGYCGFETHTGDHASVAQQVEQWSEEPRAAGSNPAGSTTRLNASLYVPVCKRSKQTVCKTGLLQFVGSNPTRHTIRPLRQVGLSRQPLKLESAVRVCQGSYKHLCEKGALCRGRLTVGQQLAKLPSRKSRHVSSNLTLCAICLLVRVVDEIGPENRRWETVRRFESFSKRHCPHSVRYPCR